MSVSPYKKMKTSNQDWVAYVQLGKLGPHRGYKLQGIMETNHAQYGKGQQAYIISNTNAKYRTQLPGKYLARIGTDDIKVWKEDAARGHNPYLVFREKLLDNSYRLDVIEKSAVYDDLFKRGEPFPELEDSIISEHDETRDDTENNGGSENGDKQSGDNGESGKEHEQSGANGDAGNGDIN